MKHHEMLSDYTTLCKEHIYRSSVYKDISLFLAELFFPALGLGHILGFPPPLQSPCNFIPIWLYILKKVGCCYMESLKKILLKKGHKKDSKMPTFVSYANLECQQFSLSGTSSLVDPFIPVLSFVTSL